MEKLYFSLIIPCFNEEKRLPITIKEAFLYLDKNFKNNYEIIFVNDGSIDKTLSVIKKIYQSRKNIKIISYLLNRGKGYAVKNGVMKANGTYIIVCDADFSIPITEAKKFLFDLESGFDIAIGTKKHFKTVSRQKQSLLRRVLGKGFTVLTNKILGISFSDITCGFKAFKKDAARAIFKKQVICNWSYDAETLFLAKKMQYKIIEIPVVWRDIKGSKVVLFKSIYDSFLGLLKIRINNISCIYN